MGAYQQRRPRKPKAAAKAGGMVWAVSTMLLTLLIPAVAIGVALWPAEHRAVLLHEAKQMLGLKVVQRCPPEGDRFHDHCLENRNHYQIRMDWSCLGERRSIAMRHALDMPTNGGAVQKDGVGTVASWLTAENAELVRKGPCIRGLDLYLSCRHCKPTPKPKPTDELRAKAAAAEKAAAAAGVLEPQPDPEHRAPGVRDEGAGSHEGAEEATAA